MPALVEAPWDRGVSRLLDELERDYSEAGLETLRDAAELAAAAVLTDWRAAAQTRFFRLRRARPDVPLAREASAALGLAS